MQNLLSVINELQDAFAKLNMPMTLDLPIIAVVGSQSVGKSSVLESIVGSDLLPRGMGTVTRRPLILQLNHLNKGECYAEFQHQPAKRYSRYVGVTEEIEAETKRALTEGKSVSSVSINLKIYAQNVPNLTLVDLPGLVSVTLPCDDPSMKDEILNMVFEQIKKPNCLILAVSAGNVDLSNSEALRVAKEVDPTGNRTIGVLTKLDIIDKGTEEIPLSILQNKAYFLKHGFFGVVCRSQEDIQSKKAMNEALAKEEAFFASSSYYSRVLDRCGIQRVSQRLSSLLTEHIMECLPSLKANVISQLETVRARVSYYGLDIMEEVGDRSTFLLQLISRYANDYQTRLDGSLMQDSSKGMMCGAKIRFIFSTIFTAGVRKVSILDSLSDEEIYAAILNVNSLRPSLLVPESSLEILVRKQLHRLLDPSLQCVTLVYNELVRSLTQHEVSELHRLPVLSARIVEVMTQLLQRLIKPTTDMIKNLIKVEEAYISLSHPDVLKKAIAIVAAVKPADMDTSQDAEQLLKQTVVKDGPKETGKEDSKSLVSIKVTVEQMESFMHQIGPSIPAPSSVELPYLPSVMTVGVPTSHRGKWEVQTLKELMKAYFSVVEKSLIDLVPKTIMAFLINESKSAAQNELLNALYSKENIDNLLQEHKDVAQKRKESKRLFALLEESLTILNKVSTTYATA